MAGPHHSDRLPAVEGAEGWFALAPQPDIAALGELLAHLRASGQTVRGFVDRAALLAACYELPAPLTVLELSPMQLSVSVASRDADTASLRRQLTLSGGERALTAAWLELARATLVQQTRFDPLHDQRHEQQLRASLPQLAAEAERSGRTSMVIEATTGALELVLTRDQLATAASAILAPLSAALQALSAANGSGALLVPAALLDVPGIEGVLAGARFTHQLRLDPGHVTRALRLLPFEAVAPTGPVPYRTQLPRVATPGPADAFTSLQLRGQQPMVMATHVVYRGRALPLPAEGVVLGRDAGESALPLPDGIAGLSRRHCTLRREQGRSHVVDHSSHGTFLDGARVRGRALLPAGSTLRLGDPGVELQLVALDAG
jgi:hypothetical protein